MEISKEQYEEALKQIEKLMLLVTDTSPKDDNCVIQLKKYSDIVEEYEKIHYPIK